MQTLGRLPTSSPRLLERLFVSMLEGCISTGRTAPETLSEPTFTEPTDPAVHWKQGPRSVVRLMDGINNGVASSNVGSKGLQDDGKEGKGGRKQSVITCYNKCGGKGHINLIGRLPGYQGEI
jgi:hypothetical protein